MIDYQNLPSNSKVDWFMQPTATNEVHTWTKPSGCNFVYMIAVGGGGGGGGGTSGTPGQPLVRGGNGGASGCLNTLLVPAFLIPDTLFIKIGIGGNGGTTFSDSGTAGQPTIISAYRVSSVTEYLLFANGGEFGRVGANGAATTPLITNNTLGTIGKWQGVASIAGTFNNIVNSLGTNGTNQTFNFFLSGGAGGATKGTTGNDFTGGNIVSAYGQVSSLTVVSGGAAVAGATAGQNDGGNGFFIPKRFASYGGAGGGASNTGVGGRGGKGGPGSGGGGGGAGVTSLGGNGGRGGDGFAVIISY